METLTLKEFFLFAEAREEWFTIRPLDEGRAALYEWERQESLQECTDSFKRVASGDLEQIIQHVGKQLPITSEQRELIREQFNEAASDGSEEVWVGKHGKRVHIDVVPRFSP
jgi:hypothetical protein